MLFPGKAGTYPRREKQLPEKDGMYHPWVERQSGKAGSFPIEVERCHPGVDRAPVKMKCTLPEWSDFYEDDETFPLRVE